MGSAIAPAPTDYRVERCVKYFMSKFSILHQKRNELLTLFCVDFQYHKTRFISYGYSFQSMIEKESNALYVSTYCSHSVFNLNVWHTTDNGWLLWAYNKISPFRIDRRDVYIDRFYIENKFVILISVAYSATVLHKFMLQNPRVKEFWLLESLLRWTVVRH